MIEMAPQLHEAPPLPRTEVTVHELEPSERLCAGFRDQTIYVSDGVLYVVLDDDEVALTAGDQVGVRPGELRHAWNAGDETARVVVAARSPRHSGSPR